METKPTGYPNPESRSQQEFESISSVLDAVIANTTNLLHEHGEHREADLLRAVYLEHEVSLASVLDELSTGLVIPVTHLGSYEEHRRDVDVLSDLLTYLVFGHGSTVGLDSNRPRAIEYVTARLNRAVRGFTAQSNSGRQAS